MELAADLEGNFTQCLLWLSPFLVACAWGLMSIYGKSILFMHAPGELMDIGSSKYGIAAGALTAAMIVFWWVSVRTTFLKNKRLNRWFNVIVPIAVTAILGILISYPRTAFVFQESVKSRAPQLDYARNIVYMRQALTRPHEPGTSLVALVGSSQINLGVDSEELSRRTEQSKVEKFCLPGMVPMQYQAMAHQISERGPDVVVCWMSEFDFFRERRLPSNRLRWSSTPKNFSLLFDSLLPRLRFINRAELADLAFASMVETWKQRELFQMLAFRFWWRFDAEQSNVSAAEKLIGARLGNHKQGIANAKQNILQTPLLNANFSAFADFARILSKQGTRLIVIEGESHPELMAAYSSEFRLETRRRLNELANEIGFQYITFNARPSFDQSEWRDAVHLNDIGKEKLTRFVAETISKQVPQKSIRN